ncbi:hypothetical protein [Actinocatenispora rupis]|uniref:Uncharacterized protein n=1 Tax=Actinocatenispora rupis TaxID=519421 RepID=A0A8J3J375_9ACTN|nr:hypothetical protein [Actinocatenispora rupis]GID09327.1 hypothetical protein Aru02nite_02160 [Actinocatenispora rupis]
MMHPIPRYRFGARRSAPFPVHLTAFVMYLAGLATALAGAAVWAAGQGTTGTAEGLPPELVAAGTAGAVVLLVDAVCWWLLARFLQQGRRWARVLVLALSGLALLALAGRAYWSGPGLPTLAPLALPVAFLVLLNTTPSRTFFRQHR